MKKNKNHGLSFQWNELVVVSVFTFLESALWASTHPRMLDLLWFLCFSVFNLVEHLLIYPAITIEEVEKSIACVNLEPICLITLALFHTVRVKLCIVNYFLNSILFLVMAYFV